MEIQTVKLSFVIIMSLLATAFTSCDSEEEDLVNPPVILYPEKLVNVSNIRMFTNKIEITDKNKIAQFIDGTEYFNLPDNFSIKDSTTRLFFHSKDSIIFGNNSFGYNVKKDNNRFLFYSRPYIFSGDPKSIFSQMQKYTTEPTRIYYQSDSYITREIRVAYGSYSDLELCFLAYKISKNNKSSYGSSYSRLLGRVLNEFDPKVINTLGGYDTLAIQEYRVKFRAK